MRRTAQHTPARTEEGRPTISKPRQRDSAAVPKRPTDGWMRHELEACGVRALGVHLSTEQMVNLLRGMGYDVEA